MTESEADDLEWELFQVGQARDELRRERDEARRLACYLFTQMEMMWQFFGEGPAVVATYPWMTAEGPWQHWENGEKPWEKAQAEEGQE